VRTVAHLNLDLHGGRLSLLGGRSESPFVDRFHRVLIKTGFERFHDSDSIYDASCVDRDSEHNLPGYLCLSSTFRVLGGGSSYCARRPHAISDG